MLLVFNLRFGSFGQIYLNFSSSEILSPLLDPFNYSFVQIRDLFGMHNHGSTHCICFNLRLVILAEMTRALSHNLGLRNNKEQLLLQLLDRWNTVLHKIM